MSETQDKSQTNQPITSHQKKFSMLAAQQFLRAVFLRGLLAPWEIALTSRLPWWTWRAIKLWEVYYKYLLPKNQ